MDLVVFGAQGIALGAYHAIRDISPLRRIRCFLVTELGKNEKVLEGLPVLELRAFVSGLSEKEKKLIEVLIATPEDVMPGIEASLDRYGLCCHVRLTASRWAELMSYHHVRGTGFMPLSALPIGYHKAKLYVFMARHHKDKPLSKSYDKPGWVVPIQVGAAMCSERVAELSDLGDDTISDKNGNYSELTALYWIWKERLEGDTIGTTDAYYGLCHYRRVLALSEDDRARLVDNDIDVVLPYPLPYTPDINAHHERYLKKEDWDAVLRAVSEVQPGYVERFSEILRQRYLYNYNILLARKDVLTGYCRWLFPILERVEDLSVPKGKDRADRYIGYVGETLETLYFMADQGRFRIAHTGCHFLT